MTPVHPSTHLSSHDSLCFLHPLATGHPACVPAGLGLSGLGSRRPHLPASTFAKAGMGNGRCSPGASPPPSSHLPKAPKRRQQLPFPSPRREYGAPTHPTGNLCFPLPLQTGNWSRVEFNQSSFARGPGSDPITTRWQCSPGRSHAPPAHPLFNQGADKAVIFFPPDLPKEPQRGGLGRRVMPGLWSGLEEATRTKEQEKEQFPSREVGTGSRYGALSSVVAFCLSQQCEAFASSKHPPSSQIAGHASARGSHPATRIFRTPRCL